MKKSFSKLEVGGKLGLVSGELEVNVVTKEGTSVPFTTGDPFVVNNSNEGIAVVCFVVKRRD